jgi:aspartyl/asparaginyl beta-hydroxylase (cupin superfamily)
MAQLDKAAAQDLAQRGVAALRQGDGAAAQTLFAELIAAGQADPVTRLMLARAYRLTGDAAAEQQALDHLLESDPDNLAALLMRGDGFARSGDVRAATSFYQTALKLAAKAGSPPADLVAGLQAAQAFLRARGEDYKAAIKRVSDEHSTAGDRFSHAIEMLSGEREIYPQAPSVFYYPYFAQRQFFEREEFDWAPALEAAAPAIKAELLAVIEQGADFQPYVEAEADRPVRDFHGMLADPSWSALYLWKNGQPVEENASRCPRTMDALSRVPMTFMGARTPSVLFSLLRPGAHIPPHHGMLNSRLIGHLPLIVPPGCWLRVGNETRSWEEGKLLIFDDSIEHEARNTSGETRIILLFDIWRPELTQAERDGISAIFSTIDQFVDLPEA